MTYSPDFSLHISCDKTKKLFKIKDTITDTVIQGGEIPEHLLNYKTETAQQAMNRFMFLDNQTIQIVNEQGSEKILSLPNYEELAFNYIPEFTKNNYSDKHYRIKFLTQGKDLLSRYSMYKSSYYLEGHRNGLRLYQDLISVIFPDYAGSYNIGYTGYSFSFLHWSIVEQICKGEINIDDLDENTVKEMMYSIFPGGNTLLHKFAEYEQDDDLRSILKIAHTQTGSEIKIKYHVPLLPNFNGDTCLHIANRTKNYKLMDTVLKYLKVYDVDHHSRAICNLIPMMITQNLPEIETYLSSRLHSTP